MLVNSPGFGGVSNIQFVHDLANHVRENFRRSLQNRHPEILKINFPIEIDNDVRCATRYVWKREKFDDVICIFVGNGLGSGIVLGGKMLYGCNFTAGEIGHVTISEGSIFLKEAKCKCRREGSHWEMYASSYGMVNIARNLDSEKYRSLKQDYETIIKKESYQKLLEKEEFRKFRNEHFHGDELSSYFFSLALRAEEEYACKVVKEFIKYLAIGIANYLNVINPKQVYLGGGMIEAFYTDSSPVNTVDLLEQKVREYALPSAANVTIKKWTYKETKFASIGAALIFKDQSYFDYKNRKGTEK
jgi:predicted NBD/HSP70 family sugar kinase